jgi:hypothetical protein
MIGGKAVPYGIYDTTNNEGWVSVGCDSETAQFTVKSPTQGDPGKTEKVTI